MIRSASSVVKYIVCRYSYVASSLTNQFVHLTNYSINKHNEAQPCDKWPLRALWAHLSERGHDVPALMQRIVDVILKALVCAESAIVNHLHAHVRQSCVCYELLGFDVLLDEALKPWLLEVNISPSLQSSTDVDRQVKMPLARDSLNLAGLQVPPYDADTLYKWGAQAPAANDARTAVPRWFNNLSLLILGG